MAVEWTTQSEARQAEGHGNGYDTQPLPMRPAEPEPVQPPLPEESVTPPVTSAPPPIPTHHAAPVPTAAPQAPSSFEHCPSCGAQVAVDQRYCLQCGHRRGEPRLPFMDAVVFMDAMNQPPEATPASARSKKRGISPNAALIAGIGTLLLALGIGVLIGRSGNNSTASAPAPQVVTVAGGSAEEGKAASGEAKTSTGGSGGGKGKNPKAKAAAAEKKPGGSATTILPNNPNVHLPPPKVQIGEKCNKEVAGCNSKGEYDGSFFGGE